VLKYFSVTPPENSGGAENSTENSGPHARIFFCYMYELSQRHPVWVAEINVTACNSVLFTYVYMFTACKGVGGRGVWGSGLHTDKHLLQSPFTGKFFQMTHFELSSMSLIFLRSPGMVAGDISLMGQFHKYMNIYKC
jgi:hypothetical protein